MEKKNILKLLALIVLMTVACCGVAFANTTTQKHEHNWVSGCNHVAQIVADENWLAEVATAVGHNLKTADCQNTGIEYVCCENCPEFEQYRNTHGYYVDGTNVITAKRIAKDYTNHVHTEMTPVTAAADLTYWGFADLAADCKHGAITVKVWNCCNVTEAPVDADKLVTTVADGWRKVGNEYRYFDVTDDGKKVSYAHPDMGDLTTANTAGTKLTSTFVVNWYDVKIGVTYNNPDFPQDEITAYDFNQCGESWIEFKCDHCNGKYKVYFGNANTHYLVGWDGEYHGYTFDATNKMIWTPSTEDAASQIVYMTGLKDAAADKTAALRVDYKAEDCLNGATYTVHCAYCDFSYTFDNSLNEPALGHKWAAAEIKADSTCLKEGYKTTAQVCERCELVNPDFVGKTTTIDVKNHDAQIFEWMGWTEKRPLYNDEGKMIAGEGYQPETIAVNGIYVVDDDTTVPYTLTYTLTKPVCGEKDGLAVFTCSLCNEKVEVIVEKTKHAWEYERDDRGNIKVMRDNYSPLCTVDGEAYQYCVICEVRRTVEIPAEKEHDLRVEYEQKIELPVDAHGKAYGYNGGEVWYDGTYMRTMNPKEIYPCYPYTVYTWCNGTWISDEHVDEEHIHCAYETKETKAAIDATKHVFPKQPTFEIDATCEKEGAMVYNCLVCKQSKQITLEKLNHKWTTKSEVAANCEEAGKIVKECSVCKGTEEQIIPATGHELYVTKTPATCYTKGSIVEECTNKGCNYKKTTILDETHVAPSLDNASEYTAYTPATCTTAGSRSYKCLICGVKVANEVIPAYGHINPESGKYFYKEQAAADVVSNEFDATCTTAAGIAYQCPKCKVYIPVYSKTELALNHGMMEKVVKLNVVDEILTAPTCDTTGKGHVFCTGDKGTFNAKTGEMDLKDCGKKLEVTIKALGHDYESVWNPNTNAFELICSRCEGTQKPEADNAKFTATLNGNKLNIKVVDKDAKLYEKVYARVSVGKKIGDINYAVVYVVEIEWSEFAHMTEGSAKLANIQGAGENTGISVVLTLNPAADELTFAESLNGNVGTLIP